MKLSDKVQDYISDTMNYDMDELMERLIENIDEMKVNGNGKYYSTVALDECCVNWGDYFVMDLDDYTKRVFKEAVDRVVNVIKSFEEDKE